GLGHARLRIAAVISREPDSSTDLANLFPHIVIPEEDLAATGLVQRGSRIRWRLLIAGDRAPIDTFRGFTKEHLGRGQLLEDVRDARPEVRVSLERSERFLKLSALLSVFLAAAALGLAARRYVDRHLDTVALLRTLGLTQSQILALFLRQYAMIASATVVLGLLLGFSVQFALAATLAGLFQTALPPPGVLPALQGSLVALVLLFGFGLPPILRLRGVSPLRVFRRDEQPRRDGAFAFGAGAAALLGLLIWQAGDARLAVIVILGLVSTVALAAGAAFGLVWALPKLPIPLSGGFRFGLRNVGRRRALSVAQVVALSLGMMALMLLTVVRGDLVRAWQRQLPADAPSRFVINIQPEQREPFAAFFTQHGLKPPELEPMVRGRLTAINDSKVTAETYPDEQARRMVEREFNLSFDEGNSHIEHGRPLDDNAQEFSVEEGLAKTLHLKLGDKLTYDIAGSIRTGTITSLRKVDWGSFRANFFVVGSRALIGDGPASYITSFYLPEEQRAVGDQLSREFPTLTVFDISSILAEVKTLIQKALRAIEVVFAFSVLAGLVVLYAATLATQNERRHEAALLRTLGASRKTVGEAVNAELLLLGGLSGLIAAAVALGAGAAAARFLFDLPISPSYWLLPAGFVIGALAARLAASPLIREVLKTPPLRVLR
ncbi:MAG TPA: FtsX-like permease family protein, partial [Myxococcales bacterium]|nr:FtsX-like permease family protein [Myxococcales bacterium]